MTCVRFYRDSHDRLVGFSAIGHAGAGDYGEDIVCAGISALTQTAVNALEAIAGIQVRLHIGDGYLSIRLPKGLGARQRYDAQIILRTAQQGLKDMAQAYPQYLRIS